MNVRESLGSGSQERLKKPWEAPAMIATLLHNLFTVCLMTTLMYGTAVVAADVRVQNASPERIWVSYALYYYTDGIDNGDSIIEGGWSIQPGETKTLFIIVMESDRYG